MIARSLQLQRLSFSVVPTAVRASAPLGRFFSAAAAESSSTPSAPRPGISLTPNTGNPLVNKVLSPQVQDQKTRTKLAIHEAIKRFQKHPGDMGSTAVQIMILTEKLLNLTRHFLYHHKDKGSTRGHQILLARRRKLFEYLKRTDVETYKEAALTVALVANDVDVALSFTAAAKKKEERDSTRKAK